MKLGVYIGSFDPVHIGHINIVNFLIKNNYIDEVLIVPTLGYWNKKNLVDLNKRIDMLKIFESSKIHIDTTHNAISYTIDLMNCLSKEYNVELYLIIGADNLVDLDKWKNYQELLKYKIIVIPRNDIDTNLYIDALGNKNFIIVKDYKPLFISSTEIRKGNNEYLDKRVLEYVKNNKLYGR